MSTYADFISELEPLLHAGRSLFDVPGRRQSAPFRKWRHELTDSISHIERSGYKINCSIAFRDFDVGDENNPLLAARENSPLFARDLQDTIVEIKTLIERFNRFGDPGQITPSPPTHPATSAVLDVSSELKVPERLTPAWLWQNASLSLWTTAAGALAAAFALGLTVGQSQLAQELFIKFRTSQPAAYLPVPASSSPQK